MSGLGRIDAGRGQAERLDRRRVVGRPGIVLDIADRGEVRVRAAVVAGVGIREEAEEAPEGLECRSPQGEPRATPGDQEPIERRRVEIAQPDRPRREEEVRRTRLQEAEGQLELPDLAGVETEIDGLGGHQRAARCLAGDECLGENGQGLDLRLAPTWRSGRVGHARGTPRSQPWAGQGSQRSGRSSR